MRDYATTAAGFDLSGPPPPLSGTLQALNALRRMLRPACPAGSDRVVLGGQGWQSRQLYLQRAESPGRFANFLQAQGVRPGDCVAGLLPRTPELLVTILGALAPGRGVPAASFTAFGRRPSNTAWRPPATR